ncbi:MAG TPA: response regulator [Vicinamibacteria bacterium]|nr:response regulator [Vicinamibacteria bacterium]
MSVASILIVDDEVTVQATFRDVLALSGYDVTTVSSMTEAMRQLETRTFDVLLTDLMLPGEDGMSLLGFATNKDPEISVVMVTGHPDLASAVTALKQGAYDYITKPITPEALAAVVERACERRALLSERGRLQAENQDYQRSLEVKVRERTTRLRESEKRFRELFRETRLAYEELKRTQEKLIRSERLAAVGELAAQIAHEIRNPLAAISNSVGVLRRDLELQGDDRRLLEVVHEEAQRLGRIVADFLKFARPRPLHRTPLNLVEVLDDLLLLLSQQHALGLAQSQIRIEKDYQKDLPPVSLDAAQTREALWNLLVNAVEAMPGGGTLRVVVAGSTKGDDFVEVTVSDTGKGIRPEDMDRIFQPFHTTKADGTGLGLAIVQRVVEAHAGEVLVESRAGQGSSFLLRFSLISDERQPIETHR